jgi:hypothetical protein
MSGVPLATKMVRIKRDPEVVWRRLIRMRCEMWLMWFGKWPSRGSAELAFSVWPRLTPEPEPYGPPFSPGY